MASENIKNETPQLQPINTRALALSTNRQAVSTGPSAFAQAFDTMTQAASATVPSFTGNSVINAAVSAAGQSRMAVSGPPMGPGDFSGGGYGGGGAMGPGMMGGDPMSQMNMQIDRMAASNAMLMSAQVRVGELTTQNTGISTILKAKYENETNTLRNVKVS